MAQRNLDGALEFFRKAVPIGERLVRIDSENGRWQYDLSVSYERIGSIQRFRRNFSESMSYQRNAFAIRVKLTKLDASNTDWQHSLAMSYTNIGDVQKLEGNLAESLTSYLAGLEILERLTKSAPDNGIWQRHLHLTVERVGYLSYDFVVGRDFERALQAADQAIALAAEEVWLHTNRAHALMFLGRLDEARALYLQFRGRMKVSGDKPWETAILEDFAELRKAGLAHPLMDDIEKQFRE
jgi:tetratricopeptide (TPR) repeat protein